MDRPMMSDDVKDLFTALSKFQGEISGVKKDATNPHFGSHYASLESVCDAVNPLLSKHGLCLTQLPNGEHVHSILGHVSGQWISCATPIRATKPDAQGMGSAITYARRYAAMALLGIAPEDDDGEAAGKAAPRPQAKNADVMGRPKEVAKAPATMPAPTGQSRAKMLKRIFELAGTIKPKSIVDAIMAEHLGDSTLLDEAADATLLAIGKALKATGSHPQ